MNGILATLAAPTLVRRALVSVLMMWSLFDSNLASAQKALCDVEQGYAKETFSHLDASVNQGKNVKRALDNFQKFMNSRKWKDGVPMGEQMTTAEAVRFGELRQQIMDQNLLSLHFSKRDRDIDVLYRMAIIADKTARYGFDVPTDEKSKDYIANLFLFGARDVLPVDEKKLAPLISGNEKQPCSLEVGLLKAAFEALSEFMGVEGKGEAFATLTALAQKYGRPLDGSKMTPAEFEKYSLAMPIYEKAASRMTLSNDLQRLAIIENASKILFASWQQDQTAAPGQIEHVGATVQEWLRSGKLNKDQEKAIQILGAVNERLPAPLLQDFDAISKIK